MIRSSTRSTDSTSTTSLEEGLEDAEGAEERGVREDGERDEDDPRSEVAHERGGVARVPREERGNEERSRRRRSV